MALLFNNGDTMYVVLDQENIDRIQTNDPFEIDYAKAGTTWLPTKLSVCFARTDEYPYIQSLADVGKTAELIEYLSRGFRVIDSDFRRGSPAYGRLGQKREAGSDPAS